MHIIDCDIHQTVDEAKIKERLPRFFRESFHRATRDYVPNPTGVLRLDAKTPSGGRPGSDPAFLLEHHVEAFGISKAILTGSGVLSTGTNSNLDFVNEFFKAYNDQMIEEWLDFDDRFYGAISVGPGDPQAAAAEIRRSGAHPRVVQVVMCSAQRLPLGQRHFWPIYEACVEMGLPFSVHPGSETGGVSNGFMAGPPSSFLEYHTNLPQNYMGHVVSFVLEGTFEKFPALKFIAIEGGLAWIPGVLWRMDKNWKALRSTVPWVKRLPSEYILENVRFTTQPIEEPTNPKHMLPLLQMIHADKTLMFSSDYPHWDNDNPHHFLPRIPREMEERIMYKTAAELYGFTDLLTETPAEPEPAAA
jgi:predicted TIM-barrel fold metal-dependent hydrolase